jgi:hypothetical protein
LIDDGHIERSCTGQLDSFCSGPDVARFEPRALKRIDELRPYRRVRFDHEDLRALRSNR